MEHARIAAPELWLWRVQTDGIWRTATWAVIALTRAEACQLANAAAMKAGWGIRESHHDCEQLVAIAGEPAAWLMDDGIL
jgi:hypothetical protein